MDYNPRIRDNLKHCSEILKLVEAQQRVFKKKKKKKRQVADKDSDKAGEEEVPNTVQKRKRGRPKKTDKKQKGQEA